MSILDDRPQLMSYSPIMTTPGYGLYYYREKADAFLNKAYQGHTFASLFNPAKIQDKKMPEVKKTTCRVVRVFIVDPDEKVPLDKAVLLKGEEQLTNLTDEELFLEIGIKPLLDKHNDIRKILIDKKASERAGKEVCLEPIRIRDLKMVVSCIAEF